MLYFVNMSKKREFPKSSLHVCYNPIMEVNRNEYNQRRNVIIKNRIQQFMVPKQTGKAWEMRMGDICRITVPEGSQVGDINMWNLKNPEEHFYSGKTRQIHRSHLTVWDSLWSCLPYIRPMATITADSLQYGFDEDGASVHDVIGTRCDPYTYERITGKLGGRSCHSNLMEAVQPWGIPERLIHDVWNIFMCSAFHKDTHQYCVKASPARKGDYIEFLAEMDLLIGLSVCPHGNVSIPVGEDIPDNICFPLEVEIFRKSDDE